MKSAAPALLLLALLCLSQGAHVADSIECSSWGRSQCNRPGVPDKCPGMCSGSGSSGSGGVGPGIVIINDGRAIVTGGTETGGAGGGGGFGRRSLLGDGGRGRRRHWWLSHSDSQPVTQARKTQDIVPLVTH
ncbi:hypothetical protein V8C86DRAFT_2437693 [Haematococcus lacustris]